MLMCPRDVSFAEAGRFCGLGRVISLAIRARMPVQANAATRFQSTPGDYHPDDHINRSQHIHEVGNLKHDSCLSADDYPPLTTPRSVIWVTQIDVYPLGSRGSS